MFKKARKIIGIIIGILILGGVIVFGIGIYQGCHPKPAQGSPPSAQQAGYELIIKSTGQRLYTDAVQQLNPGAKEGARIYRLESCWESTGEKYIAKKRPVTLDERYFGLITVKKR